jgi:hypothetical protein
MINSVMRGVFLKDSTLRREFRTCPKKKVNPCWFVCFMRVARWTWAMKPFPAFLAHSRQYNPALGITGILCCMDFLAGY